MHGTRGATRAVCAVFWRGEKLDLSHTFVFTSQIRRREPGGKSVSALLYSRALTEFSGQSGRRVCAVARGAIAGASALLSSFEASSAVTRSSRDWMAAALLPEAAVFTARSDASTSQSDLHKLFGCLARITSQFASLFE